MVVAMHVRKVKEHFKKVAEIKTSPNSIALGFAIGTFIAIFPTPGFSIILGLLLVLIFPKISKIAMISSFVVWNPIVLIPIFAWSYKLGDYIMGSVPVVEISIPFFQTAYNFSRRFLLGNIIIGSVASLSSYIFLFFGIQWYRSRKKLEVYEE